MFVRQHFHSGRPLIFLFAVFSSWAAARWISLTTMDDVHSPTNAKYAPRDAAETGLTLDEHIGDQNSLAPAATQTQKLVFLRIQNPRPAATSDQPRFLHNISNDIATSGFPARLENISWPDNSWSHDAAARSPVLAVPPAAASPQDHYWQASAWLLLRQKGTVTPLGSGGQYGGSQAGARLAYRPLGTPRVEIYTRLTSALHSPADKQAAFGLAVRPMERVNIAVAIEQRLTIDGPGPTAPAAMVVGGFGPTGIARNVDVEAYGQAGAVGTKKPLFFADGALAIDYRLNQPSKSNGVQHSAGLGVWGGAQSGTTRMDIGPRITTRIPTHTGTIRISLDWRERVAGSARPGSGPALTVAADF